MELSLKYIETIKYKNAIIIIIIVKICQDSKDLHFNINHVCMFEASKFIYIFSSRRET